MMRFLLLLLPVLSLQYWEDSEIVSRFREHVSEMTLSQYEGRAPGSEGEKAVSEYVWDCMSRDGLDMLCPRDGDLFGIATPEGDTLLSRNIIGFIQGYDAALRGRFIVVGARMDNLGVNCMSVDGQLQRQIYTGANGNASGVSMLIELAAAAARSRIMFRRSVLFVGFGASTATFAGAWHFLNQSFGKDKDKIDAMVNLDMLGVNRDGLKVFTCGNEDLNLLLYQLSNSCQPLRPTIVQTEPYPSDHQIFYGAEIPSVLFTTGKYPEHNTARDNAELLDYEFMEREHEYIYNYILTLANCKAGIPAFNPVMANAEKPADDNVFDWSACDVPPMFLNNADPSVFLKRWVYTYLKYPEDCIRDGVQGRVVVEFIIDKKGDVCDVKVVRSVDEELDAEAVKVVSISPRWKPAKMGGRKVACRMTIPVEFRLKKKKNAKID